jgi:adenylate cyclase
MYSALAALRQIGPLKLIGYAVLLLLSLAAARYSLSLPLMEDAEHVLYDAVADWTAPVATADGKITVVSYDSATLETTHKRSPKDRGMLARALTVIDSMHPKAVGIDMIFDQPQPEDDALVKSLRGMRTPTWIAYMGDSDKASDCYSGDVALEKWQSNYLDRFFARLAGSNAHRTSVMFCDDEDLALRRWPTPRKNRPLMSQTMVYGAGGGPVFSGPLLFHKPRVSAPTAADGSEPTHMSELSSAYTRIPIQSLGDIPADPALALTPGSPLYELLKQQIQGRYVLIGVTVAGEDQFRTPMGQMYGIDVHANAINQLIDKRIFRPLPSWGLWAVVIGMMLFGAWASLLQLRFAFVVLLLTGLALLAATPMLLLQAGVDTLSFPAFGSFVAWAAGYIVVGAAARALSSTQRTYAQSALGKYLPKDIALDIIRDPKRLALGGQRVDIYALFTDLEGFTRFTDSVEPELLAKVLNQYLDLLSEVVLEYGGTIDKFVGDSIIAFWGAPIARADDADRAVATATALQQAGERFKGMLPPGTPPIGRTRVGLHKSSVIVGNFGGEGRIQYTAFGDAMNTASRLESANKKLKTKALISGEALEGAQSAEERYRPMGRITVRGRELAPLRRGPDRRPGRDRGAVGGVPRRRAAEADGRAPARGGPGRGVPARLNQIVIPETAPGSGFAGPRTGSAVIRDRHERAASPGRSRRSPPPATARVTQSRRSSPSRARGTGRCSPCRAAPGPGPPCRPPAPGSSGRSRPRADCRPAAPCIPRPGRRASRRARRGSGRRPTRSGGDRSCRCGR